MSASDEKSSHPGYYPGFSTLAQREHWDDATRRIIDQRISADKPIRFFSGEEARTLQAALECILPQDDRAEHLRVPILAMIDERLHGKNFDGYIYEGTPEDDAAYRIGLAALDALARKMAGSAFADLPLAQRENVLIGLQTGKPAGPWPDDILPPKHFWRVLVENASAAYYAHPFAWDEIGFGGPAYPRGYMRLTEGRPEPWEVEEKRYDWQTPWNTKSETYTVTGEFFPQPRKKG